MSRQFSLHQVIASSCLLCATPTDTFVTISSLLSISIAFVLILAYQPRRISATSTRLDPPRPAASIHNTVTVHASLPLFTHRYVSVIASPVISRLFLFHYFSIGDWSGKMCSGSHTPLEHLSATLII